MSAEFPESLYSNHKAYHLELRFNRQKNLTRQSPTIRKMLADSQPLGSLVILRGILIKITRITRTVQINIYFRVN